jgi:hypothetical protein
MKAIHLCTPSNVKAKPVSFSIDSFSSKQSFLMELRHQCQSVIISYNNLVRILNSNNKNNAHFWYSVQSLLVSVANITKILKPNRKSKNPKAPEYIERGDYLRKYLFVPKDSPLLRSIDIRNDFEHFDERLHEWAQGSKYRILVDRNIGFSGSMNVGSDQYAYMRNFDDTTFTITFWDHELDVNPTIEAVKSILEKTESRLAEIGRLF